MKEHMIDLERLPEPFSPACATYRAALGSSLPVIGVDMYGIVPLWATNTEEEEPESEPEPKSGPQMNVAGSSGDDAQTSIFTSSNYDLVGRLDQSLMMRNSYLGTIEGYNQSRHIDSEVGSRGDWNTLG